MQLDYKSDRAWLRLYTCCRSTDFWDLDNCPSTFDDIFSATLRACAKHPNKPLLNFSIHSRHLEEQTFTNNLNRREEHLNMSSDDLNSL
jgi:hypothetical protein